MDLTITSQALDAKNQKSAESGLGHSTTCASLVTPVLGSRNRMLTANRVLRHAVVAPPVPHVSVTGKVRNPTPPTIEPLCPPTGSLGPAVGQTATSPARADEIGTLIVARI